MMYFTPFWNHVVNFFFLQDFCILNAIVAGNLVTQNALPTLLRRSWRKKIKDQGNMQEEVFKHSVEISKIYSHHFFCKESAKSTYLLLNYIVGWFHEFFCKWEWVFRFSTLWQEEVFKSTIQHSLMTFLGPILNVFCENVCLVFWRKIPKYILYISQIINV